MSKKYTDEELDAMAIDGRLSPIAGTQRPRSDNSKALNDDEIMDIFRGRPLAEQPQPAKEPLRILVTAPMKQWLKDSAKAEGLNASALVRMVMKAYLSERHPDIRPKMA
ncbi:hypothetical protein OZX72_08720 [Bifidobacterium sp. ESL0769]|uniref:hypothetical protein n=1 Tax=Bifidobacterium sp. ESL0769 TaxID=2983229 RepID=UPI0023F6C78E|nr:hypothetical protein [Bifidobacterium sp. ESL0769]WEV67299.1 hypothetical protein OZX72_08720 [Bifidobacterium sp. ESL0769]